MLRQGLVPLARAPTLVRPATSVSTGLASARLLSGGVSRTSVPLVSVGTSPLHYQGAAPALSLRSGHRFYRANVPVFDTTPDVDVATPEESLEEDAPDSLVSSEVDGEESGDKMSSQMKLREWNVLLRSVEDVGRLIELFEEMKKHTEPSLVSYNIVLDRCSKNNLERKMLDILEDMKRNGPKPGLHAYNIAIGGTRTFEAAATLIAEMREMGIEPDIYTYNTILSKYRSEGELAKMEEVFAGITTRGLKPDQTTYRIMMQAFSRSDVATARKYLSEMLATNVEMDADMEHTCLDLALRSGRMNEAMDIYKRMNTKVKARGKKPLERKIFLSRVKVMRMLLGGLARADRIADMEVVLEDIRKQRMEVDVKVYTQVLNAYSKVGDRDRILAVLRAMKESRNAHPNNVTYTAVIAGMGRAGDSKAMLKYFEEMKDRGLYRNQYTYSTLGTYLMKLGDVDTLFKVKKALREDMAEGKLSKSCINSLKSNAILKADVIQ